MKNRFTKIRNYHYETDEQHVKCTKKEIQNEEEITARYECFQSRNDMQACYCETPDDCKDWRDFT